ncbi:unnamed protein product [Symbiodinium pilosum]|uniref:Uncharacterized protein n=1 Tax=Symbiodinium pilosum TaxID=2952 RepID=A0A812IPU0_SYMPI|nr:unnamed protein product [Symbiodinium pilosum]
MIVYQPGSWGVGFALRLHGSVFPRAFAPAGICAAFTLLLHWLLRLDPATLEVIGTGASEQGVFDGFTFVLGFLIVFRSQQAYSRWWEGGTLLQQLRGEWFNSYSCLIAFCSSSPEKKEEVKAFQHQLVRLYSLLYGCALQQVATMDEKTFDLFGLDGFEPSSMAFLQGSHDRCEITLQWIQRLIVESDAKQILKIAPPILSRVFNELGNGIVNLNNARKITDFPIPFHLAQMITVMLMAHSLVLPLISAATVDNISSAGGITFFVSFAYWAVHFITIELEWPFGDDPNDLPLQDMQTDFNMSLSSLIDDRAQEVPKFSFEPQKHLLLKTKSINFDRDLSVGAPARQRMSRFQEVQARGRADSGEEPAGVAGMITVEQDFGDGDALPVASEGSPEAPKQEAEVHMPAKCSSRSSPSENRIQDKLDIKLLEEYLDSADAGRRLEGYLALVVRQLQRIAPMAQDSETKSSERHDCHNRTRRDPDNAWVCG